MLKPLVGFACDVVVTLVFASVVLSWFPRARWSAVGRVIYNATEPLLRPIRRLIPPVTISTGVGLDLSPIVLLIVVSIVRVVLYAALR